MSIPANCSSCTSSIHLWSDSSILTKEKLLSQTVCVFCWVPFFSNSSGLRAGLLTIPLLKMSPLVSSCGHMFHQGCFEHREKMYKDKPTRCPLCGYIINKIQTMHFLTRNNMEKVVDRKGTIDEETGKLLEQIENLRQRIARL